jgi:hypothetical protein
LFPLSNFQSQKPSNIKTSNLTNPILTHITSSIPPLPLPLPLPIPHPPPPPKNLPVHPNQYPNLGQNHYPHSRQNTPPETTNPNPIPLKYIPNRDPYPIIPYKIYPNQYFLLAKGNKEAIKKIFNPKKGQNEAKDS